MITSKIYDKNQEISYSQRLNSLIPGGCHTYSRGDDQFPKNAPHILSKGLGAYVWSPTGQKYLDYGMGLRSVSLGYSNDRINKAAIEQILNGNNLTRASTIELEAAETMVDLIGCSDMVKFAKNGSNVTTAAIKLARAYTGRNKVARCAQHPFFSFDDWFISDTKIKRGIPTDVSSYTLSFKYNDEQSVLSLFAKHDDIAAIILEPATSEDPKMVNSKENFLQFLRRVCDENGCLLILDEMITGFRWHLKGAQHVYGVEPDLSTFGKAMANGFSVAALSGKRKFMELGGIKDSGLERTFLVSTTHGAEMSSLGAFVECVKVYKECDVIKHLNQYGSKLKKFANDISKSLGIQEYFFFSGPDCSPAYTTLSLTKENCLKMRTIFNHAMVNNGVLMPWVALSLSHGEKEIEKTCVALEDSLRTYRHALEMPDKYLVDDHVIRPVFRKYN